MSAVPGAQLAVSRLDEAALAGIMSLEASGFPPRERWSAESWAAQLLEPGRLCRGLHGPDGTLLATGLVSVMFEDAELLRIVVAPQARGRRIATALLARLVAEAAGRGARRMLLEARRDNIPALALYRRAGFRRLGERKDYYGPGVDALVLEMRLSHPGDRPRQEEGRRS